MTHILTNYISNIFDPDKQRAIVTNILAYIDKWFPDIDYIVVRGTSGLVVGSIVAHRLKKRLVVIRKQKENAHTQQIVEGLPAGRQMNFLIIDDFIDRGTTLDVIAGELRTAARKSLTKLNCMGYLMYNQNYKSGSSKLPFKDKPLKYFMVNEDI